MNRHDVDVFLDTVSSKDAFRQEIEEALQGREDRSAATVEFAQKAGFDFSVAEFEEALARRYAGRELDDTELDAVAGGVAAFSRRGGLSIAFPDVCKTPSPGGPVSIPYPNTGMGSGGGRSKGRNRKR